MPRPKRTKISTRAAQLKEPAPNVRQSSSSKKPVVDLGPVTDDSDGLVIKSTAPRHRLPWQPRPQRGIDMTMSGALPAESSTESEQSNPQSSLRSASIALNNDKPVTGGARSSAKEQVQATPRSHPTATSSSKLQDTTSHSPSGGFDNDSLNDSFSLTSVLSASPPGSQIRPSSALKVHGTPGMENSILALTKFKRRPRQPSILRMVHQTTDVEDNDQDDADSFSDLDDLDNFNPDDESTPLHLNKRPEEGEDVSGLAGSLSSSASRSRKRKLGSPEPNVLPSSPPRSPFSGSDPIESRSPTPYIPDDIIESCENPTSVEKAANNEPMSDTMAPPRSSSVVQEETEDTSIRTRSEQMRPLRGRPGSRNVSATLKGAAVTRDRPTRAGAKERAKETVLSTAKLQALLPKRHTRARGEPDIYDLPGSDEPTEMPLDSDEDELQRPPSRRVRATAKPPPKRTTKKGRQKQKEPRKAESVRNNHRISRTYGRRSSDKENESTFVHDEEPDNADDTTAATNHPVDSVQLEAIAKKFQEVDEWEMEFETVDGGEPESSPWR